MKIAAGWLAIFLVGAAVGVGAYRGRHAQLLRELITDARRTAIAFDPEDVRPLSGTAADRGSAAYLAIKDRLRRLQAANPQAKRLHVYRATSSGITVLADSAAAGDLDEAAPGDAYPTPPPGLLQVVRTGQPATDGPFSDQDGAWITGYALIRDETGPAEMHAQDILGFDVDAGPWRRELWQAAIQGAFYSWILLGLPLVALFVRRRQDEQREVIRNLSEAMEQSHSALMIMDLENRIEYANRGLCQQIGYSRRELIGRNWREFRSGPTADETFTELVATVRSGRPWEGEWFNQRKDGSVYPVHGVVTPVKHRDESLACFVAVFDDVTDAKRREAELRDARDLAEAGDRAKGQFLATMSHEVRTPLNGIVGFTSLLLETELSSEQREYVQTIRMSTEALIQLTGDILDFARIESGKLKLEPLACDPRECLEDAFDLHAGKAAEKNLELLHRVAPDVPAAVLTDGGRLRQVLVNLIGNAVKFTERGEVFVTITRVQDAGRKVVNGGRPGPARTEADGAIAGDACLLEFTVRDTGIGIAPSYHAKLFKPFSQGDDSTTRRYGGTGLGLAISHNLVHLMGGEISFASAPGGGSTFTFTIRAPIAAPALPPHDLAGMRIGLAMHGGKLRAELAHLLGGWNASVVEADAPATLGGGWQLAIVEITEALARDLAPRAEPLPEMPADRTIALVPITLSNDLRAALRTHCRLLVNKPVHHDALFALLSGARGDAPLAAPPPTHFGFRVLIVEDNAVNQRLMQRVLTSLGCTWTVVENGRRALDELTAHAIDFDLVLLDLHMPEMDGLSALHEIRSGRAGLRAQTMWVIALTADAREDQRARALAAGLNDYLTKPVKIAEVAAALKRFRVERGSRKH